MSLQASDVRLTLGSRAVLKGVSLMLAAGQVTAIVGPNGAGKSTLLACLAGLRTPEGGEVALDGARLRAMKPRERARRLGLLPQTGEVAWSVDVRTLVGLGRIPHHGAAGADAADERAVEAALAATELTAFAERDVTTLSGGEQTRALVARVLAGEPDWILADEPLAGLDAGHQLDLLALFRTLADQGRGLVLTLHDLTLAARAADRVVVLAEGQVLADGPPRQALTPETLERAYGVRTRFTDGAGGALIEVLGRSRGRAGA